jgi:hypothetical protein
MTIKTNREKHDNKRPQQSGMGKQKEKKNYENVKIASTIESDLVKPVLLR